VITTAHKQGTVEPEHLAAAIAGMTRLNRQAAEILAEFAPHALTDITGFGLLGHAHEMAHLSLVKLEIDYMALPWLAGARGCAEAWVFPAGSERNEAYFGPWVTYARPLADWEQRLLHDAQTSGGLLAAVTADRAGAILERLEAAGAPGWVIGRAAPGGGEILIR